jgi:hypothetical protein
MTLSCVTRSRGWPLAITLPSLRGAVTCQASDARASTEPAAATALVTAVVRPLRTANRRSMRSPFEVPDDSSARRRGDSDALVSSRWASPGAACEHLSTNVGAAQASDVVH